MIKNIEDCSDIKKHTLCPEGYIQWHEWADKKSKIYHQIICSGCGYYAIWVLREQKIKV